MVKMSGSGAHGKPMATSYLGLMENMSPAEHQSTARDAKSMKARTFAGTCSLFANTA